MKLSCGLKQIQSVPPTTKNQNEEILNSWAVFARACDFNFKRNHRNTVRVTTNQLDILYSGTYATNHLVKLGSYSLPWQQAGKGADIIATLPTNILSGTYTLTLQGSPAVSVEIGSVSAAAALNSRMDLENAAREMQKLV